MLDWFGAMFVEVMRSEEIRFCHILNGPIHIMINMAYWIGFYLLESIKEATALSLKPLPNVTPLLVVSPLCNF